METIEATFRVVTPLFMSGADQTKAELRLPSIKGALRFWWRALAWGRLNGNLAEIREEENTLFGDSDLGQSGVLMKLELIPPYPKQIDIGTVLKDNRDVVGEGARYLGYGVMEAFPSRIKNTLAGQLTRACLDAPFTFKIVMLLKAIKSEYRDELIRSIKVLGVFGAIGSKARKGYGSLSLLSLWHKQGNATNELWYPPKNISELCNVIATFERSNSSQMSEFTAFSKLSRILLLQSNSKETPLGILNRVGRDQVFYRSWGNKRDGDTEHKVFGLPAEQNFRGDHDLMKQVARGGSVSTYPERIVFGLPHNYGKDKSLHVEPSNEKLFNRRASPLFIHIHHIENADPIAIVTFLPSKFLPDDETIRVGHSHLKPNIANLWQPINGFLDRLLNPSLGKEKFVEAVEL